jgi:hypothetical protein
MAWNRVGTKRKHAAQTRRHEVQMLVSLKTILSRTAPTFVEDMAGCAALCVLLYLGLMLPGFS